jgi:hypothetical protein
MHYISVTDVSATDLFWRRGGCALQAHEDVDGLGDGATDLADGFEAGESGCVEDVGTGLGEGLQAAYGVF